MNHIVTTAADRVRRIISDVLADTGVAVLPESAPDGDTLDSLGADGLDLYEMINKIEEEFGIEIPDDAIDTGSTVAELIAVVAPREVTP